MSQRAAQLTYALSVSIGVISTTAGVYLRFGGAFAAMTAGALLIAMSIYAAERLATISRQRRRLEDQDRPSSS